MKKISYLLIIVLLGFGCSSEPDKKFEFVQSIQKTKKCFTDYDSNINEIKKYETTIDTMYSIELDDMKDENIVQSVYFHSANELNDFKNKLKKATNSKSEVSFTTKDWSINKYKIDGKEEIVINQYISKGLLSTFELDLQDCAKILNCKWKTSYELISYECNLSRNSMEVSKEDFYK
jgi:hypothetical protein